MFSLHNIKKKFGSKNVLKDISFTIKEGDKIALLGCNGAGKSTLFKIIAGQVKSDSGLIKTQLDFKNDIGMMPQDDLLIKDLTVKELVLLKAYMNKLKDFEVESMLSKVELSDKKKDLVGDLSGGQQRRLSLLLSLLNNPRLLFLDEPTTGMDLASIDNFWKLLKDRSCTSVIVTHDFNQIDQFFSRVLILKNGYILADESVAEIHKTGKTIEQFYRDLSNLEEEHD
ncbi:SkfA peptide export ATP-binding protein SkfE [Streptococcus gordonii]|mgnify:FL=1|jgi:ABC transporter, ATP-binding protein|uniref:ABC transporter ATP-binding protein n=2 Tax=Streptococcus gordonii TaxID=1302 RepID=A8AV83_STRGC|nr:ABC transporter ATP-binding protein [Streptococcus gordonii]ABV10146.1 ABC transporter ATP-binding protein [Streptococcus gordonii str. Challis substr. CH1]KJQ65815.1 ABC transporter ATP-binding protein [Streptococcus gordonii]MBZ2136945.1 ABC transporter ATP-binding protein [Streptococcus gordonii]QGS44743.1 ATP-binding cassette domain-containing protein [Streptococcus gordonii]RSJ53377.1 SkfA peptide export ATP-binding protein SkfE [Streptococcus gordonii]